MKITKRQVSQRCQNCGNSISVQVAKGIRDPITRAVEDLVALGQRRGWDTDNGLCPYHKNK